MDTDIHLTFDEFQTLATGADMPATVDAIEKIKNGKKYVVDNEGSKFRVVVKDDNLMLEPLEQNK